ncbi:M16 family metallopeptidase [Yersinia enterocolitica]|uniref:Probable exported Zinc protease n=1 Tax=Yersinia enterocolitica serotype O:8 / biotype 1B (strain NCTC 13174 / 8081) TaxID=393305 RepID=A1JIL3_YERE8|nr:insulinase family protein [Yersinia enterocolitica]AJJ24323.1 insulinase family protein [Yersinia enterocolitica]CAL10452.1 probable exported Zinc protease [Yersinia enterocolitica subsp. enterocolitica 8081]HDL8280151.1 insulinase family protein [Yersinia enterocolitica]HDM8288302.1 insulinase family protein [Yersinia enterocolitica]HDM8292320.1 insulinase family protein [Yersinia enterocolitica]
MFNQLVRTLFVCLFVGCVLPVSAQEQTLPVRADLQHFTLGNGMQVYLLPRDQPGVELRLLVNSGSLQESEQQRGLAHFVEHMAFKGTRHFPGTSSFKSLEKQGITLGSHVNAVTSLNATTYKLSLPNADEKQLTLGLRILSDWAQGISFEPAAFDKERQVIVEEWRLRQGVGFRINQALEQLRYHGSRYAERDPIGLLAVVRQAPVSEAVNYYQQWYQPQRMALVVVGQFKVKDLRKQINELFAIPVPEKLAKDDASWSKFAQQPGLMLSTVFDAEQGTRIIQLALQRDLAAPLNSDNGQWRDLLDTLWLTIFNQRLSLLVDNDLLSVASINQQGALLDKRRIQHLMIARPQGSDYNGTLRQLFTELQRMATAPVSEAELNAARQQILIKLSQQAASESRYQHGYLADNLTTAIEFELPMLNKQQQFAMTKTWLEAIGPQHVQAQVAELLQEGSARLALIGPDSDKSLVDNQQLATMWNSIRQSAPGPFTLKPKPVTLTVTPPPAGKIVQRQVLPIPDTQLWTLSNGIRVIVKANNRLKDDVQLSLRIPGGRSLEDDSRVGEVNWAMRLPEVSGYSQYNPRQLAQLGKQTEVAIAPYDEMLFHGLRGSAPADKLEPLLQLLYLKISAPQFSAEKLAQQKQSFGLGLEKQPVERRFLDSITQAGYQHGDRLLVTATGPWRNFTVAGLEQRHRQLFSATQDMTVTLSGALDEKRLQPLVEKWLGSLPRSEQRLHWRDLAIKPLNQAMSLDYPLASSPKTMVSMQFSADANWSQPNLLALQLLDKIVTLRLRYDMREQASGIYTLGFSQLLAKLPQPYYLARLNFTSAPERSQEMAQMAQKVLQQIATAGVTQSELDKAKKAWWIEQDASRSSASYWTDALAQVASDDGNFALLAQEEQQVKAVTLEQVNVLAAKWLGRNPKVFSLSPAKM